MYLFALAISDRIWSIILSLQVNFTIHTLLLCGQITIQRLKEDILYILSLIPVVWVLMAV